MDLLSCSVPFVLLEDCRPEGRAARLYIGPREIVRADRVQDIAPAMERVRHALKEGLHAAGWLTYETGFAFEQRLLSLARRNADADAPLLWFGLFDQAHAIERDEVAALLPDPDSAWLGAPQPRMTRDAYERAFARTQDYITAGDVYQINLSYRADIELLGHPLAAYARLRGAGQGGWSAAAFDGADWLLSTSPELFFHLSAAGNIEARPMKGTAKRGATPAEDVRAAAGLRANAKELAENVMIVDLLRNDISRIAKRGSVHVPELFAVETYPTLHTLTSTVRAEVREGRDAVDAVAALFPCGSITGAPKIRAMEIIDELENDRRGAYTGSIGWMAPDGSAAFNVAIRTLSVASGRAEIGLGSAVTIDSTLEGEWEECRVKGAFVTANAQRFDLIETMRFDPANGIGLLDLHLDRLQASAAVFSFAFDRRAIELALEKAQGATQVSTVRLLLSADGATKIEVMPLRAFVSTPTISLAPLPVHPADFRLRHKTTLRGFYDTARVATGSDEVVFIDPAGYVTEGSFTNVFVERDGVLITPPAKRGLLPGVLRAALIASGRAREQDLRSADLVDGFFIGNALRGLTPAHLGSRDLALERAGGIEPPTFSLGS